jgi:uncharacterized protein YmfQ (DUF2313 family)
MQKNYTPVGLGQARIVKSYIRQEDVGFGYFVLEDGTGNILLDDALLPDSETLYAQVLANYLPNGKVFFSKNILESNLRRLLYGLAGEFARMQNKIFELSEEYDLTKTIKLIEEWERALGIPDECFDNVGITIDQRRLQIIAKFSKMHLVGTQSWIELAECFGFVIRILYGKVFSTFEMEFPIIFTGTPKQSRFTMIIKFLDLDTPINVFTMKFPIPFAEDTNLMKCLFNKLKPANVTIIWRYRDQDDSEIVAI